MNEFDGVFLYDVPCSGTVKHTVIKNVNLLSRLNSRLPYCVTSCLMNFKKLSRFAAHLVLHKNDRNLTFFFCIHHIPGNL